MYPSYILSLKSYYYLPTSTTNLTCGNKKTSQYDYRRPANKLDVTRRVRERRRFPRCGVVQYATDKSSRELCPCEGRPDGREYAGRQGVGGTGNVFKFMAAFKTPSANGRGLQRATAGEEEGEPCKRRERGKLGGNMGRSRGGGGFCLMHSDA